LPSIGTTSCICFLVFFTRPTLLRCAELSANFKEYHVAGHCDPAAPFGSGPDTFLGGSAARISNLPGLHLSSSRGQYFLWATRRKFQLSLEHPVTCALVKWHVSLFTDGPKIRVKGFWEEACVYFLFSCVFMSRLPIWWALIGLKWMLCLFFLRVARVKALPFPSSDTFYLEPHVSRFKVRSERAPDAS